jgi:hypothetical protein
MRNGLLLHFCLQEKQHCRFARPRCSLYAIAEFTMSLHTVYTFILLMCMELGHAIRRQTAGQFGPDLAKKLSQLVKMEKNVMRSMELVGRERMEVAVSRRFRHFRRINRGAWLIDCSNNSPFGARHAMTMFRMSRTSLVSCSTRLVSLRISMLIVMINTVLLSRASETLRLQFSPAETVSRLALLPVATLIT